MPRGVPNQNADIRAIRQSLHSVVDSLVRLLETAQSEASDRSTTVRTNKRSASPKQHAQPRRARLSRARLAVMKLQGEYIGRMRGLKPAQKARVKAVRARKGFPAAIRLAARLAS